MRNSNIAAYVALVLVGGVLAFIVSRTVVPMVSGAVASVNAVLSGGK
jgi:hypothetical protein